MPALTNFTAVDLDNVAALGAQGNLSDAWNILADHGDAYAYLAQYVVSPDPVADWVGATAIAKLFRKMLQIHWNNSLGETGDLSNSRLFISVGQKHLANYVELLADSFRNNGVYTLPDTKQIEASYRDALTSENLKKP